MINIPYWLAGAAIYISAFFITLSIGLFFVDVPLKLGFALLMLPISIALWPFEPTRGKLSENFSIIIRNAMLFTLVSIGISYGITLIESSVTYAINDVDFDKAISELSAVNMAKQFAFSGLNCLIIGFCLIYAYLLVQSSVNDYLNRLFPDNVFGGDSAVHQRAVQAFGNMATHTILPVASLATDIVRNQAGSLLIKGGEGLKNIGHNPNPRNQGGAGGPDGGSVEPVASDNTNTPTSDANEDATSPEIMPFAQHNPETATDKTSRPNRGSNPSRYGHHTQNRQQKNKSLADLQRARARQQQTQAENQNNNSAASSFADNEAMRNSAVEPDNAANGAGRSFKDAFMMGMKNADQGQYSLSVGTILKNAGKVANSPFELLNKKTYTQLAHLDELQAKQAQKAAARRQAEDALMPGMTKTERVIMRGGQLFMRTAKDTRNEAAYAAGSILSGLGKAIKPSENKKSWSDRWDKWQYDKEQEELEEQERQQREATLIDQFEERN